MGSEIASLELGVSYQDTCIGCGRDGEVRYIRSRASDKLIKSNSYPFSKISSIYSLSGPYDKTCSYELKFKGAPLFISQPNSLTQYLYRAIIREELDDEKLKLFKKRIWFLIGFISLLFYVTYFWMKLTISNPLLVGMLGGITVMIGMIAAGLDFDTNRFVKAHRETLDKLYRPLRNNLRGYMLEKSSLKFIWFSITYSIVYFVMLPVYLTITIFFTILGIVIYYFMFLFSIVLAIFPIIFARNEIIRYFLSYFKLRIFKLFMFLSNGFKKFSYLIKGNINLHESHWNGHIETEEDSFVPYFAVIIFDFGLFTALYYLQKTYDLGYLFFRTFVSVVSWFAPIISDHLEQFSNFYSIIIIFTYFLFIVFGGLHIGEYIENYSRKFIKNLIRYRKMPLDIQKEKLSRISRTYPANKEIIALRRLPQ